MLSWSESVEDDVTVRYIWGDLESELPWLRGELLIFQPLKQQIQEQVLKHQLLVFLESSSEPPELPSQLPITLHQQFP